MCDTSGFAIGIVLGQRDNKNLYVISYASCTFDEAQCNYHATKKELFVVIFALKSLDHTFLELKLLFFDHATLKHLLYIMKSKPKLIKWILFLQEFDLEINDNKLVKNQDDIKP